MATILEFRAEYAKTEAHGDRAQGGGSAEVVIFPGVRYERPSNVPRARSRGRRPRQRDRLELED